MAIRDALPNDIHNMTLNIEALNDLEEYLIRGLKTLASRRHIDKVPHKNQE